MEYFKIPDIIIFFTKNKNENDKDVSHEYSFQCLKYKVLISGKIQGKYIVQSCNTGRTVNWCIVCGKQSAVP